MCLATHRYATPREPAASPAPGKKRLLCARTLLMYARCAIDQAGGHEFKEQFGLMYALRHIASLVAASLQHVCLSAPHRGSQSLYIDAIDKPRATRALCVTL